ncbi:MAG: XRE family transcriptional regulator [Phascolarctobacterium sp.]|nr:MAG: XRE family transcriptional regulator [Phascolarctobacterium sp.]
MGVSYKKLWKLLIDKDMKKKELAIAANISTYTINRLNRGENVNTDTLVSICKVLDCTFDDIMELVPDEIIESQKINNKTKRRLING